MKHVETISKTVLLLMVSAAFAGTGAQAGASNEIAALTGLADGAASETLSSAKAIGLPLPAPQGYPTTGAATEEYLETFNSTGNRLGAAQIKKLSACRILFVPGFMTDSNLDPKLVYKSHGPSQGQTKQPIYFDEQVHWLRAKGIDAGIVKIESEAGIKNNAALIAAEIEASPKPVIIIGHSKGGLDALEALVSYPSLRGKVKGFIAIQSPFFGTPVADYVLKHPSLFDLASTGLSLMGGSIESVHDLSEASRAVYMRSNAGEIEKITSAMPAIAFGSWKKDVKKDYDTTLEFLRDKMDKKGIQNDGIIPTSSTALPGAAAIAVEGCDHLSTVEKTTTQTFNRISFIKTLLAMLLTRSL